MESLYDALEQASQYGTRPTWEHEDGVFESKLQNNYSDLSYEQMNFNVENESGNARLWSPPATDYQSLGLTDYDRQLLSMGDNDILGSRASAGRQRLTFPRIESQARYREDGSAVPNFMNASERYARSHQDGRPQSWTLAANGDASSSPKQPTTQEADSGQVTTRYHQVPHTHHDNGGFTTPARPTSHGIPLVSTEDLPERLRNIFPFQYFNAIQSKCFQDVYNSDNNFVLSSPTGSGKTVIFELAIARIVGKFPDADYKIVYMALTKALCSERKRDWGTKFAGLDLKVEEMTGDSEQVSLRAVQSAHIVVTTPEKWDSMTRKWKDHEKLTRLIRMILIDEVHILGKDRGATLEAVVSRMKSVGSQIRFIALSATAPNVTDIATWLGRDFNSPGLPAVCQQFGEEFRPVKLVKHVVGYGGNGNDFQFDATLNKRLPEVIQKYSAGRPIMVFCFTRSSCVATAESLAKWRLEGSNRTQFWPSPSKLMKLQDDKLRDLSRAGVAVHHAGIESSDRSEIERGYLEGDLGLICCTSTLAVGVNLPCHLVIIKGTVAYEQNGPVELCDMEIFQMLGRAGRPKFDTEGVAVIMTRSHRVDFFTQMLECQQVLESRLHLNLIEHLNAEIGLCSVKDLASAVTWLKGTFLYVRLRANPDHYQLEDAPESQSLDKTIENICTKDLELLELHDLIRADKSLDQTAFGAAMARYCINFNSMKILIGFGPKPKLSEILSAICSAHEFNDIKLRSKEKAIFQETNRSPSIRFPFKVDLAQGPQKVSLIIQATLGGVDTLTQDNGYRSQHNIDREVIFQHARRLIRCTVDCQVAAGDSIGIRNALMLVRSLGARVWDDSPLYLQQLETIGPVAARRLISAGIRTIDDLLQTPTSRLETVLSRNPPYGRNLLQKASAFPRLQVSLALIGKPGVEAGEVTNVSVKAHLSFFEDVVPATFNRNDVYVCMLAETTDGRTLEFVRMRSHQLKRGLDKVFKGSLLAHGQSINVYVSCEEIAGTQQQASLTPDLPPSAFAGISLPEDSIGKARPPLQLFDHKAKALQDASAGSRPGSNDEWDDAAIDDSALVAFESNKEWSGGDDPQIKATNATSLVQSTRKKSSWQELPLEDEEPERLSNGNWKCRHRCKDKTKCGHSCCTNGMESKPKKRSKASDPKPEASRQGGPPETQSPPKQTRLNFDNKVTSESRTALKRPLEQVNLAQTGPADANRHTKKPHTEVQDYCTTTAKIVRLAQHTRRETDENSDDVHDIEDEFDGFDDIDDLDADLPLLDDIVASATRANPVPGAMHVDKPRISHNSSRTQALTADHGRQNFDHGSESDEDLRDAALVGAADSVEISNGPKEGRTDSSELPETSTLSASEDASIGKECVEPRHHLSREDRRASIHGHDELLGQRGVKKHGVSSAERAELEEFVRQQFGDLVKLV